MAKQVQVADRRGSAPAADAGDPVTGADAPARLRTVERRRRILDQLQERELVTVTDLAEEFGLTEMSLRRDLSALAEQGLVTRVRGGARQARVGTAPRQYRESEQRNAHAKNRIARFAASLLDGYATAFFYSGSTVARVAQALGESVRTNLTVVTASMPVINEVVTWTDPHLVVVGGVFLPQYMTFVGPQAVASFGEVRADVAVVGCDGISTSEGLTTPHHLVAEIGSVLIERAERTIVVADSSKIGRRGFTPIAPASAVDVVVTDAGADPGELAALRSLGVEVFVV